MILSCPACSARFAVPDALIPPEGRVVKCGRCKHDWHVDAIPSDPSESSENPFAMPSLSSEEAASNEDEAEDVTASEVRLPVVVPEPRPQRLWLFPAFAGALLVLWCVAAFYSYYPRWMTAPVLRSVYAMMGTPRTDGLVFEEGRLVRNALEGGKTQFLISGSVGNRSAEGRQLPRVRVQLLTKDNDVIWSRNYDVQEPLKAGASYPFRIENIVTTRGDEVATIRLDLGNSLQLRMR
jgi:predicted Zn finger-like uncharacterized protein